jgi:chemotaxis protein MotB
LLKQSLATYGTVTETERGIVLTLAENIWTAPRVSSFTSAAMSKLDSLGALLANNPDYNIEINSHTDGVGDANSLNILTQERAQAIADRFIALGVDAAKIKATGLGSSYPIASNSKPSTRVKNRRTEIVLVLNVQ